MGDQDKSFRERISDMFNLNQDKQQQQNQVNVNDGQLKGNQNQQSSSKQQETKVDNDIKSTTNKDHVKRFENPSYLHGVQDSVIGSIKEGFGKMVRDEGLKETGIQQQNRGSHEMINATVKDDDKYDETFLMDY